MGGATLPNSTSFATRDLRRRGRSLAALLASPGAAVARSAASVFALRVAGAGLAYLLTLVLVRTLGAYEFGIYAQLYVAASLLGLVLPIGLNGAVLRFIPEYSERQRPDRVLGVIGVSRLAVLAVSISAAAVLAGGAVLLRAALPDGYFWPLLLATATLPLLALLDLYESFARGFGWTVLAYAPPYVVMPVVLLSGALLFAALGRGDATAAMAAFLVATATALVVLGIVFHMRLRRTVSTATPRRHTRIWVMAALPLVVVEASRALMEQADVLMLGVLSGPEPVAAYFAAARTAGLLGFVLFSVGALTVPAYARLLAGRDRNDLQGFVRLALHLSFWPTLGGVAALGLIGRPILAFFDPAFVSDYPALLLLAAGFLVKAAAGPVEYLLSAAGDQRAAGGIYFAGATANVALNAALIPAFGIVGAAGATTLSVLLVTFLLVGRARRRLGVVSFLVPGIPLGLGGSREAWTS